MFRNGFPVYFLFCEVFSQSRLCWVLLRPSGELVTRMILQGFHQESASCMLNAASPGTPLGPCEWRVPRLARVMHENCEKLSSCVRVSSSRSGERFVFDRYRPRKTTTVKEMWVSSFDEGGTCLSCLSRVLQREIPGGSSMGVDTLIEWNCGQFSICCVDSRQQPTASGICHVSISASAIPHRSVGVDPIKHDVGYVRTTVDRAS
jgi:hypothetical protein